MSANKNTTKVVTGVVRLSYANVWEAVSINGGTPKYSVSLIIPKSDTKTIEAINAAVDAAIKEGAAKFGGKIPNKAALKLPLRDGDVERDDEAYAKPKVSAITLRRTNDIEAEMQLVFNGSISPITVSGTQKNSLKYVQYRYKLTSESSYGSCLL